MDTLVCNLSQGGVAIMGPDTDCVGTTGEISITLPGPGQLDFEGHIIWNETSVETPCMGFCFDDLPRDQRAALANFLLARFHRP